MCGIAGIFRLTERPEAEDAVAVLRMLEAEVHRGPDDWGLLVPASLAGAASLTSLTGWPEHVRAYPDGPGPGVILGSRRLSILDLSPRGRMPMGVEDGRLWITHNGEIYNYRDLGDDLRREGNAFRSAGDSEVILRGYATWGDAVVPRLRGMFAFAVFEALPRPRLLLARDRFGIKPLYYYRDHERVVFASEVRALLRSGLVPGETNPEALVRFLQLGSVPSPLTTVKGAVSIPAGHCLRVEADGPALRRYWDFRDDTCGRSEPTVAIEPEDAGERVRCLLQEAVELHLVSDVPLGVFLSGGIDSSALVAVASTVRSSPLTTLSIVFDEPAYTEAAYARLVADRYRTDHREIRIRSHDFFDGIAQYFGVMDEPTVDGPNTYLVSAAARRAGLTVVLSGTGGDEVFLGYAHHRRGESLDRLRRVLAVCPPGPRSVLLRIAAGAAVRRTGLARLEYLERPSPASMYLAVRGLFGPKQVQALLGVGPADLEAYGPALPEPAGCTEDGVASALERFEFTHYLQNQLLKDTDVMSMAHSVETRVPYLDHRLAEYVRGLPIETRLEGGAHKPLLRRALGDLLPREVWDRPKMGFTLPFDPWMRARVGELEAASLEGGLLQRGAVEQTWRAFRARRTHWSRAWALVVLARLSAARKEKLAA